MQRKAGTFSPHQFAADGGGLSTEATSSDRERHFSQATSKVEWSVEYLYHLTSPNVQSVCLCVVPTTVVTTSTTTTIISTVHLCQTLCDVHFIYCLCSPFPTLSQQDSSTVAVAVLVKDNTEPGYLQEESAAAAMAVTYFFQYRG